MINLLESVNSVHSATLVVGDFLCYFMGLRFPRVAVGKNERDGQRIHERRRNDICTDTQV